MINGPNVTFRRPTVEDDELVFQSYIDWQDLKGPMTRSRASDVLRFMLGENEHSHWPIDYRSLGAGRIRGLPSRLVYLRDVR